MSSHSLNSPSSFSRRIGCPGSANAERGLPNKSSVFAAEGTAAHELGEICLGNGSEPAEYMGEMIKASGTEFEVNQDMIDAVTTYTDYCRNFMTDDKTLYMIEKKFDLGFLGEGEKGTSDFTGLHGKVLHVIDYKHGKGVAVEVEGNVQGLCYGLGASKLFQHESWDILRITIVQPRAFHDDGPIRTWDVPRDELLDYMLDYAMYAKATESPEAPRAVGDWCRFCKAKPICPTHMKWVEDQAMMDFAEDTSKPIPVEFLTDNQLADLVLNKIKMVEQWCQAVKDHCQQKAEAGNPLPGTKLVATRANRMWKDKKQAEEFLRDKYGDEVYEKKFMSAPKVEKKIGKQEFAELSDMVEKRSTGVTLVPESDKRPSVRPSAEDDFS